MAERLVSLNLSGRQQQKMRHDENVLTSPVDDDLEERLFNVAITRKPDVLLRSTNHAKVIDPERLSWTQKKRNAFYHSDMQAVMIELAGKSLASHISRHHAPKTVQFLVGQRPVYDAICYAATKHLLMSGIAMNFIEVEEGAGGAEVMDLNSASLVGFKSNAAYFVQNANRVTHLSGMNENAVLVNATLKEYHKALDRFTRILTLDHASKNHANKNSMICWDFYNLLEKATHLHTHHPHVRLFLLNAGRLDCGELAELFQTGSGYEEEIQLIPFIK